MLDVAIKGTIGTFDVDAAFNAPAGVTALFGPSGAGKTSILRAILGLWEPQEGRVVLNGKTLFEADTSFVPTHERNIAAVLQSPLLFPHLSVEKNLGFAGRADEQEVTNMAKMLDVEHLLNRMPRHLSGGEAQRVALGRALLAKPDLLLLDEPLTGLDAARRDAVLPYLERLCENSAMPILYVSHNIREVKRLAQQVVQVDTGRIMGDTMDKDQFE